MQEGLISITVPVYNEKGNLALVCEEIDKVLSGIKYELIFVDDNSKDGTYCEAKKLSLKYPIKIIRRHKKLGLASAMITGFMNSDYPILGVIDGDGQHDTSNIKKMIELIVQNKADLVIGSRYIKKEIDERWARRRKLNSYVATWLSKPLVGKVTDPMAGFFLCKRDVIYSIKNFKALGYKLLLEIIVKARNIKVYEIPMKFRVRTYGKSKLNLSEIMRYLILLGHLYKYRLLR